MVCIKSLFFADFVCMVHIMYDMVRGVIPFFKGDISQKVIKNLLKSNTVSENLYREKWELWALPIVTINSAKIGNFMGIMPIVHKAHEGVMPFLRLHFQLKIITILLKCNTKRGEKI